MLVNPLSSRPEIAYQIRDANVGAVFTTSELADRLPPGIATVVLDDAPATARVLVDGATRTVDLGSHVGLTLEGEADAAPSSEEAVVVYTSAFAGLPLGAILTHANLLSNPRATIAAGEIDRTAHMLAVLPFAHLFGLVVSGAAPLLVGGRVTTVPRFNPARVLELVESDGITHLVGVPSVFATVAALAERRGSPIAASALRLCICGGAPLSVDLQNRWFDLTGVELRQGYGLTEAGPVCLFNRVDLPNRRGMLGVPLPGVRVSVRSEHDTGECPMGETGEICVAGPNVFKGYVNPASRRTTADEPWAAGLARDGEWLRTGDRGAVDPDGSVSFRGLIKPMFTRNGFNIYPREIERAVAEMPNVQSVRVRALPEPLRENDIAIDVVGAVSVEAVKHWCDERLAVYKRPSAITVTSGT